jgi:AhpD family alkylhydroperoxidase
VDPALNEAVMVTVNSVNECPYCTLLHTEGAAKLVGGFDGTKLQGATTAAEARASSFDDPAITFAHAFGETGGYGPDKDAAYAALVAAKGAAGAKAVHALCRYMMWGGRTGNTIQGFLCGTLLCHPRPGSWLGVPLQMLFELLLVCYYAFLFLVAIPVVGKVFKHVFPAKIPHLASGLIGCTLVTVAGLFIVPMGLLGGATYPLQVWGLMSTAPRAMSYTALQPLTKRNLISLVVFPLHQIQSCMNIYSLGLLRCACVLSIRGSVVVG